MVCSRPAVGFHYPAPASFRLEGERPIVHNHPMGRETAAGIICPTFTIEDAIEAFALGFSRIRSVAYPYVVERAGRLWLMRDEPAQVAGRVSEFISYRIPAVEAVECALQARQQKFAIAVLVDPEDDAKAVKAEFKKEGLRLLSHEKFFVRDLAEPVEVSGGVTVRRVLDASDADLIAVAAGRPKVRSDHLGEDSPIRTFAAFDKGVPVGWVTSVDASDQANWVANLYVLAEHRQRGFGRALMTQLLVDDQRRGVRHSVLLSSTLGAMLYPSLGYKEIGVLQIYMPGPALKERVQRARH
jgi:GNAT superfamily N-acetyltransferase